MIGELIAKAIPWIIPFILFCSWVYNWKGDSGSSSDGEKKASKSKETKRETPPTPPESPGDSGEM